MNKSILMVLVMMVSLTSVFALPYCNRADINRDGTVDGIDLTILADNWLKSSCGITYSSFNWWGNTENLQTSWCNQADINRDGKVDTTDLVTLSNNWRSTGCKPVCPIGYTFHSEQVYCYSNKFTTLVGNQRDVCRFDTNHYDISGTCKLPLN